MSEKLRVAADRDKRSVLIVVRKLAEIMLSGADPEQDDEDIADALIAGLRDLVPGADVLRARFARNRDGDLDLLETHDVARLRTLNETDETLLAALSATQPVSRHGHSGEVTSLIAPLVLRASVIDLFVLQTTAGGGLSDTDALALSTLRDLSRGAIVAREA